MKEAAKRCHAMQARPASRHGQARVQGRAMSPRAIDYVVAYGREQRSRGASKYYLDRQARQRLRQAMGEREFAQFGHKLDIAVVLGDDERLVTAMYRTRRIRR